MKKIMLFGLLILSVITKSQTPAKPARDGLKFYLNADSSAYLKATGALQVWLRYSDNNPGSALQFGNNTAAYAVPTTFDIGIRRARFQLFGPLSKRVFFYSQFGMNNFSYISTRKQGAFFHDLVTEYSAIDKKLSIGAGLTGWSGLSRYASPSIATTLMYDAPLFQQATNDVSDQFLRKLSVYAKGKLSKLDYRVALSKPMPVQLASTTVDTVLDYNYSNLAGFSPRPAEMQAQGYLNWQFLDQESNAIPYTVGSYLGKKRVFNLGAGFIYQPDAMRHLNSAKDIVYSPMQLWSVDAFLDYALNNEKENAITLYGSYSNYNFGPNYIRSLGVMNPVNAGTNPAIKKLSGFGNAFPMFGTGDIFYLQAGYLFKKDVLKQFGTLQPVADIMLANYHALNTPMIVWDAGVNWLIKGNNSKISLDYQSRPVYEVNTTTQLGTEIKSARRGMMVLQYQVFF